MPRVEKNEQAVLFDPETLHELSEHFFSLAQSQVDIHKQNLLKSLHCEAEELGALAKKFSFATVTKLLEDLGTENINYLIITDGSWLFKKNLIVAFLKQKKEDKRMTCQEIFKSWNQGEYREPDYYQLPD